ncbi:MAG TPA: FAD-binding protein [Ilumatobacteraceae bacterium]|nr:FAD-binding protein [Ilumatobacteraceae bacterium]
MSDVDQSIDLAAFAVEVGTDGPVTIAGLATRGGPCPGVRTVRAPAGIAWIQPDEMTACCGAATPVDELVDALAAHGQTVALPRGGTVGGALAIGRADIRRLGWGPVRDVLLQARYVSAAADVVKAGGPTVKNVSGFDLCRLLVGSRGALGFIGEVILRTRPLAAHSEWFTVDADDPSDVFLALYRPVSALWEGRHVWALLEGHPADVADQARGAGMRPTAGPPDLPTGSRRLLPPASLPALTGTFVAELGVGVVHHAEAWDAPPRDPRELALANEVKRQLDPTGRLNPCVDV